MVGALAGALTTLFRLAVDALNAERAQLSAWAVQTGALAWALPVLLSAVGAGASVWLVRALAPEAAGSGIPDLKAVLHHLRPFAWGRVLPVKFVGGLLALGSGLALGREGPSVQMGGAVGAGLTRLFRSTPRERLALIAAGAGAGLAAAFNAPLAGVVFVLEEVQRDFTPAVFTSALLASASADAVSRLASGQLPAFVIPAYAAPPITALPAFLLLGAACGLLGVVFNKGLILGLSLFARFRGPAYLPALAVGALVGAVGLWHPQWLGGGHALVERAASEGLRPGEALPLLFARLALTFVSYGCGTPGGIFAPLLALGATLGTLLGDLARWIPGGASAAPEVYAVVGMAALFAGVVRAPLTAVVLLLEMTGNYAQMLPVLAACFAAYAVAEGLRDPPIYDALLARDLRRAQPAAELGGLLTLDLRIELGAPYDGAEVRALGLPPGVVLTVLRRRGEDVVVTAGTRLEAGDVMQALISPQAAGAVSLLREGVRAP